MFNPIDYDLNREYRQRQMAHSIQVKQADEVQAPKSKFANPLLQANLISMFWIVASVLSLIIYFIFSAKASLAQENTMFSAGTPSDGGGDVVYIYLRAAILAIADDEFETASEYLDEALYAIPEFAPAYVAHSYIALQRGNDASALDYAEMALAIYPDDAAIYFVLAEANFALGNYIDAHSHYDTYLEMVNANGHQPILITSLLGTDSLILVREHLAICLEESPA